MDKLKDEAFKAALMKLKAKFAKDPQDLEDYAEEMEKETMSPEAHEMEEKAEYDLSKKDSDLAPEIENEEEGEEMADYSVSDENIPEIIQSEEMKKTMKKEGQPMTDKEQMMFAEALKAQGSPLAMRASKEAMKMAKMKKKA